MNWKSLLGILGLAVLILAMVQPVHASSNVISVGVKAYTGKLEVVAYSGNVTIDSSGSSVNVEFPRNTSAGDWEYMVVQLPSADKPVNLTATLNGTVTFSGTVQPLSSNGIVLMIPVSDTVELSSTSAWNGTIRILLGATVAFQVTVEEKTITLDEPGESGTIHYEVDQTSGPGVWVWWSYSTGEYTTYIDINDDLGVQLTSGALWGRAGDFTIKLKQLPENSMDISIPINLMYSFDYGDEENPENAHLAATVTLSGTLSDVGAKLGLDNVDAKSLGLGVAIAFVLGILFLGGSSRRRGAGSIPAILFILAFLAAVGLAMGLMDFDMDTRFSIDPKMLGVGILAMLALILLVKQGTVPAPRAVRKLFR